MTGYDILAIGYDILATGFHITDGNAHVRSNPLGHRHDPSSSPPDCTSMRLVNRSTFSHKRVALSSPHINSNEYELKRSTSPQQEAHRRSLLFLHLALAPASHPNQASLLLAIISSATGG